MQQYKPLAPDMKWKDEIIHLMGLMSFHKITQQQLANAIGYNKETIYRWLKDPERYKKKFPMIRHGIETILAEKENGENETN